MYHDLKDKPREFLAATSLTHEEFAILLPNFQQAYEQRYPVNLTALGKKRQRKVGGGAPGQLPEFADKLFFILVFYKTNPLQTMHALQFALGQPRANYWLHRLLPVLQDTLAGIGMKPEREGGRVGSQPETSEGGANLALDGTERRLQRPQDPLQQKAKYSGKKKCHTDKNILLVNENSKKVVYLSPTVEGKKHDKKAVEEAAIAYPANATLTQDTGFQGYAPLGVLTMQPTKKAKGQALSLADKLQNQLCSSVRIVVENVLAGVKRCRIVKDLLRLTTAGISDMVMEIACGLHNLRVTCRQPPQEAMDLLDFVDSAYSR